MRDTPETIALPSHPIIFFDGVCELCNTLVDRVLRIDTQHVLRFAPLQGETARAIVSPLPDDARDWSMLFWDGHTLYSHSDAPIQLYRHLGGWRKLAIIAWLVPRWIRDPAYRLLARNRYRWFGQRSACRLPNDTEQERFLP